MIGEALAGAEKEHGVVGFRLWVAEEEVCCASGGGMCRRLYVWVPGNGSPLMGWSFSSSWYMGHIQWECVPLESRPRFVVLLASAG